MYEEFDNGYTISIQDGKAFISYQRVSKRVPYYKTEEYLSKIDASGRFEFSDLTKKQEKELIKKIKSLSIYIE